MPRLVAYLEHGEAGLLGEGELLCVAGVGVVAVIIQPLLQDLDRVLRQISPPPPGARLAPPPGPGTCECYSHD